MLDRRTVKIGELGQVLTGRTPPSGRPELLGNRAAFITPTDINEGSIYPEPQRRLSEVGEAEFKKLLLPRDTVCFTCIASIGKMCLTREKSVTNQQINAIIVDHARYDPRWVFYSLRNKRDEIAAIASGSATPIINKTAFSNIALEVPSLEIQRRIAAIIGAYDDLIEVNRRRVAILEEMARGLFEEWFVRFRFPGHEAIPKEDTPNGPIPQGWSWGIAGDLVSFDPRTKVAPEGMKPFVPMGSLDTMTSLIAPLEQRSGNAGAKFRNGDTLFARITPCLENGKTGLVRGLASDGGVGFGSTEFIVMRGERAGPAYTYCLSRLRAFRDHAKSSMSGATGRQRARTDSVASFLMAVPHNNALLDRFEQVARPMLDLVGTLGLSMQKLSAARDALLPRLISGQLSILDAVRKQGVAA